MTRKKSRTKNRGQTPAQEMTVENNALAERLRAHNARLGALRALLAERAQSRSAEYQHIATEYVAMCIGELRQAAINSGLAPERVVDLTDASAEQARECRHSFTSHDWWVFTSWTIDVSGLHVRYGPAYRHAELSPEQHHVMLSRHTILAELNAERHAATCAALKKLHAEHARYMARIKQVDEARAHLSVLIASCAERHGHGVVRYTGATDWLLSVFVSDEELRQIVAAQEEKHD